MFMMRPPVNIRNGTTTGIITTPTAANFGATVASAQENYARRVQVSVKFLF